jgi:hypothetical protein
MWKSVASRLGSPINDSRERLSCAENSHWVSTGVFASKRPFRACDDILKGLRWRTRAATTAEANRGLHHRVTSDRLTNGDRGIVDGKRSRLGMVLSRVSDSIAVSKQS